MDATKTMENENAAFEQIKQLEEQALEAQANRAYDTAIQLYQQILEINPSVVLVYVQLATIALLRGNFSGAIICDEIAAQLAPDSPDVLNHLGIAYQKSGDIEKAKELFEKALALIPDDPLTLCNLGIITENNWESAKQLFYKAFSDLYTQYDDNHFLSNKEIYFTEVQANAVACYANVCLEMCDWGSFEDVLPLLKKVVKDQLQEGFETAVSPLLSQVVFPEALSIQSKIAKNHAAYRVNDPGGVFKNYFKPDGKQLKIGYLIDNFNSHLLQQSVASLVGQHQSEFEVVVFTLESLSEAHMKLWLDTNLTLVDLSDKPYYDAAQLINEQSIQILLDMVGYQNDRAPEILSFQPAPIQVQLLGHRGPRCAEYVQYTLSDQVSVTSHTEEYYKEQLVLTKGVPLAYSVVPGMDAKIVRGQHNLSTDATVYACFADPIVVTKTQVKAWCKILQQVPQSVLWLLDFSSAYQSKIRQCFTDQGLEAERVIFSKRDLLDTQAMHVAADVYLDSVSINTEEDVILSLQQGVPVVALAGKAAIARSSMAALLSLELLEGVAASIDDYVKYAVILGTNQECYGALVKKIRKSIASAELFNHKSCVQHLEQAYARMWQDYQKEKKDKIIKL